MAFNPDDAARPGSGIFGLPHLRSDARIVVIPVPFDATTSYRPGTVHGPAAVIEASTQVDLHDHLFGPAYERGIFAEAASADVRALSAHASNLARGIIDRGGASEGDREDVALIDACGERVRAFTRARAEEALREGKIPALLGGEHSVSLGAIEACAADRAIGVLQLDAHMDLRERFEGFRYSHASVMWNVLAAAPNVSRLVQVGIRDYSGAEAALASGSGGRVATFFGEDLEARLDAGETWAQMARKIVAELPENVYVTFDIDALDPSLCPNTGTPVPGGLSFGQASVLLAEVRRSNRRVVGFDLVEVAPEPGSGGERGASGRSIDAIAGARILYRLCGCAR